MALLKKGAARSRKPLKKAAKAPPKPTRRPDVLGWAREEVTLVPVTDRPDDPRFPKCKETRMPVNDTFYVVDENGDLESLVTRTAKNSWLAWSWCGYCRMPVGTCGCTHGPMISRGTEFIHDQHRAESNGEEWGINHPDYKGSWRNRQRDTNTRGVSTSVAESLHRNTPAKPTTDSAPRKSLRKSAVTAQGVDKAAIEKAANKAANNNMAEVEKRLAKKPLKKRKR